MNVFSSAKLCRNKYKRLLNWLNNWKVGFSRWFLMLVLVCPVPLNDSWRKRLGKGHYYENHNVKNQKEHRKICKPSQCRKWLLSWSQLWHHNIKNGFLVNHYIEKNEKNIEKISFVWFSHFDYLWRKYLWHFGVNKNFLTWLNLT